MTRPDTQLARQPSMSDAIEKVLLGGDLSKLNPDDRLTYYRNVCESLGLNPLTSPFSYITLNGKLTLYARKDCTDQLRQLHNVSITVTARESVESVYVVTAQAKLPSGRVDEEIGAVNIAGLKGDALANAMMKASTKAKRRVTLSICGLGMLDETEVETIPQPRQPEPEQVHPDDSDQRPQDDHGDPTEYQVVLASPEQVHEIKDLLRKVVLPAGTIDKWFAKAGVEAWQDMPADMIEKCIEYVRARVPKPTEAPAPPAKPPAPTEDLSEQVKDANTFTALFTTAAMSEPNNWTEDETNAVLKKAMANVSRKSVAATSPSWRVGIVKLVRAGELDPATGLKREAAMAQ